MNIPFSSSNHLYYPSQHLRHHQQQQQQHRHPQNSPLSHPSNCATNPAPCSPSSTSASPLVPTAAAQMTAVYHARRLHLQHNHPSSTSSLNSCSEREDSFDEADSDNATPARNTSRQLLSCSSIPPTTKPTASPATMSRRARLPSLNRSAESTDSSNSSSNTSELSAGKSNYRIMLLGATKSGKTSIVRQFLYDKFTAGYKETVDDMYRGEFDIHNQNVAFDIQDVSGGYVYEFPGMRNVSLASADAFIIVFGLDSYESWEEVSRLRDMVHEVKDHEVPIVVVANKSDLPTDPDIPADSLEATVVFDWENGYVESSAKDRRNINKIFKELLQQAKSRYDFTVPQLNMASALVSAPNSNGMGGGHCPGTPNKALQHCQRSDDNLKRRQSLPAVPAGMAVHRAVPRENPLAAMMNKMQNRSQDHHHQAQGSPSGSSSPRTPKGVKRRSSLAVLRRDSCKIS